VLPSTPAMRAVCVCTFHSSPCQSAPRACRFKRDAARRRRAQEASAVPSAARIVGGMPPVGSPGSHQQAGTVLGGGVVGGYKAYVPPGQGRRRQHGRGVSPSRARARHAAVPPEYAAMLELEGYGLRSVGYSSLHASPYSSLHASPQSSSPRRALRETAALTRSPEETQRAAAKRVKAERIMVEAGNSADGWAALLRS
jgi:hypothetical protein